MKRYPVKTVQMNVPKEAVKDDSSEAFDVEQLLNRGGIILRREVQNLLMESSAGKLSPTSARDLVAYVKLLSELKAEQSKEISNLTDEELSALAKT
jgi:hypothetical protein